MTGLRTSSDQKRRRDGGHPSSRGVWHKKAPDYAGAFGSGIAGLSILRDHGTAEFVIDANGEHVYVLTDVFPPGNQAQRQTEISKSCHSHVLGAHEQMVVLYTDGPLWVESVFTTNPDDTTPARFTAMVEWRTNRKGPGGAICESVIPVAGDGCAALYIK